jgi:hypothetical protein
MMRSRPRHSPPIIWRILDDKAGHRNQVFGLTEAIERALSVQCIDVEVADSLQGLKCLIPGRLQALHKLPKPDLLIGAGHSTHLPLLVLRRRFGGRSIVLMKPSIPMAAFDLNLIASAHRLRSVPANVLVTEGPLNRVQPSRTLSSTTGLILIGGVSSHYVWSNEDILRQLRAILTTKQEVHWTLTTSRRTPASFLEAWSSSGLPGELVPHEATTPDWIPCLMQRSGLIWVTTDSMSMVFEALTAGAGVGLLELPERHASRVCRSMRRLIENGDVTPWSAWVRGQPLKPSRVPLREADRCAAEVIARFLSGAVPDGRAA